MLLNDSAVRISLDQMDDALASFTEVLGFGEVFEMSAAEGARKGGSVTDSIGVEW